MNQAQWGDIEQDRCSRLCGAAREVYSTIDPKCSKIGMCKDHLVLRQMKRIFNFRNTCEVGSKLQNSVKFVSSIAFNNMNE